MLVALGAHPWAYPMLEVVHVIGVALILGNLVLLELRVFGWASALPIEPLARLSLGLVGLGFGLAVVTGLLMFGTQPGELLANRVFTVKMALIMLAGCNAGWFHARRSLQLHDTTARVSMLLSTMIWILVITCGRWIAYV
ncbi:MAG: hypothetical protein Q8M80_07300 [Hydrogenophaga sp.]|uniref:hypothetical protein n=1 Tax=Hydrogenophaga sp. TaxID=1904254 RepID=UPI0025B93D59|nr:hypothetical protein [Hydrogenophaga sp.]MDO9506778.1 hypothetical protein [Hydrogenophaga sp.]MDP2074263.1 hypothetical protein [Hydrogenophaga sp.]MDP2986366.1 hypothetical protein [Hydrogenophaga sp.]MDP3108352.1 hypothetical protein [Hydrogenophaga sp.]MDP3203858.1 hypothetical protein [Hydrogenophaga sp.]